MDEWNLKHRPFKPHQPEILASTDEARAIAIDLPAGDLLQDHEVHERAWLVVIDGQVLVTSDATQTDAGQGSLVLFAAAERHEVKAITDARLLLLLTPWPGAGHPGTMTLNEKSTVRARAAEHVS